MDEKDKKDFIEEFKKAEGAKKLEMWDYGIKQQVVWEKIIAEIQNIAREQSVDKELEKLMDEELKKMESG